MPPLRGFGAALVLGVALTQSMSAAEPAAPVRVDRYGDPLPAGAVARLGTVALHHASVWHVRFARDGRTFHGLTGDTWTQWDAATGRLLQSIRLPNARLRRPDGGRTWLSEDGSTAMCAGRDGAIRVIDCATGKVRLVLPDWADFTQISYPLSPDGRYVAGFDKKYGGLEPQNVRIWDTTTGTVRNLGPQGDVMCQVRFSPDGKRLVAHSGLMATCWDRATGKRLWQTKPVPLDSPPVLFSPDGRLLAVVKRSGPARIEIWDANTGEAADHLKGPPDSSHFPLGFTPDHQALVLQNVKETAVWNLRTGEFQCRAPIRRPAALSPDGRFVIATPGCVLERWDLTTGKQLYPDTAKRGHTSGILAATFDPTGRRIITASWDNTVRIWDARDGRLLATHAVPASHEDPIGFSLRFTRDSQRALLTTQCKRFEPRIALIVNLETGKADKPGNWIPLQNVLNIDVQPDQQRADWVLWNFQAGRSDPKTRVVFGTPDPFDPFAAVYGSKPSLMPTIPDGEVSREVEFTADERFVAARVHRPTKDANRPVQPSDQIGVQIWDTVTGERLVRLPAHGNGPIRFAGSGRFLVGLEPEGLAVWRVATGQRAMFDTVLGYVTVLALSPDGRTALTTHRDGTALLWDIASAHRVRGNAPPTKAALLADWKALGDPKPARRLAALWRLVDHPDQSIPFLCARAVPDNRVPAETVRKLIAELDHADFRVRDAAEKQLRRLGESAHPILSEAAASRVSPEQADRLSRLLARFDSPHRRPLAAADLPRAWAVAALERIGTPAARAVLRELTTAGDVRLTHEAKAALARLEQRAGGK